MSDQAYIGDQSVVRICGRKINHTKAITAQPSTKTVTAPATHNRPEVDFAGATKHKYNCPCEDSDDHAELVYLCKLFDTKEAFIADLLPRGDYEGRLIIQGTAKLASRPALDVGLEKSGSFNLDVSFTATPTENVANFVMANGITNFHCGSVGQGDAPTTLLDLDTLPTNATFALQPAGTFYIHDDSVPGHVLVEKGEIPTGLTLGTDGAWGGTTDVAATIGWYAFWVKITLGTVSQYVLLTCEVTA